jgi:DNA-binding HxlR family transcriptional regulator
MHSRFHKFNVDIAKDYGVNVAIMLENFGIWFLSVQGMDENKHDNKYWFYHTISSFIEDMPYLGRNAIRKAISDMNVAGLIEKAEFNDNPYDHTTWYTLTQKGMDVLEHSICQNDNSTSCEKHNSTSKNIKNNIKKDLSEKNIIPPTIEMVSDYIQENHYHVDANAFIDFYASKGWLIGKNKMKDWQSAVRTWERNHKDEHKGGAYPRLT